MCSVSDQGYGCLLQLHDVALQADRCTERAKRIQGARLVPPDLNVGAVRISASGWEGWILEGLQVRVLWAGKLCAPARPDTILTRHGHCQGMWRVCMCPGNA